MATLPAVILLGLDEAALVALMTLAVATVIVLALPPALALWCARRQRRNGRLDEEGDWASQVERICWVLWLALERYVDLQGAFYEAFPAVGRFGALMLVGLLPGLASMLASWLIWFRIPSRYSSPAPTLGNFLAREFDSAAASLYFPFMLSTLGFSPPANRMVAYNLAFAVTGLGILMFSLASTRRLLTPAALDSGDLFDRAMALASRAGTRIRALRVVEDDGARAPNAYAMRGRRIGISAEYVREMPPDQVDATIAHEIAHVRHRDLLGLYLTAVVLMLLANPILSRLLEPMLHPAWLVVPHSLCLLLGAAKFMRRCEYRADALAADLTSPETEVRALCSMYRLSRNLVTNHPLLEIFSSHPSLVNRARAVARHSGQTSDWLRAILLDEWSRLEIGDDLRALAAVNLPVPVRTPTLS